MMMSAPVFDLSLLLAPGAPPPAGPPGVGTAPPADFAALLGATAPASPDPLGRQALAAPGKPLPESVPAPGAEAAPIDLESTPTATADEPAPVDADDPASTLDPSLLAWLTPQLVPPAPTPEAARFHVVASASAPTPAPPPAPLTTSTPVPQPMKADAGQPTAALPSPAVATPTVADMVHSMAPPPDRVERTPPVPGTPRSQPDLPPATAPAAPPISAPPAARPLASGGDPAQLIAAQAVNGSAPPRPLRSMSATLAAAPPAKVDAVTAPADTPGAIAPHQPRTPVVASPGPVVASTPVTEAPARPAIAPAPATLDDRAPPPPASEAPAAIAPTATAAPQAAPAPFPIQTGIDLRQAAGVERMIDHIEQLRDAAATAAESTRSTRISLSPEALGRVEVSVTREGDAVRVHFTAVESGTRQLLAEARPQLTELAEARGVRIERATVGSGDTDSRGQQQHPGSAHVPAAPPRARAAAPADEPVSDTRIA